MIPRIPQLTNRLMKVPSSTSADALGRGVVVEVVDVVVVDVGNGMPAS